MFVCFLLNQIKQLAASLDMQLVTEPLTSDPEGCISNTKAGKASVFDRVLT